MTVVELATRRIRKLSDAELTAATVDLAHMLADQPVDLAIEDHKLFDQLLAEVKSRNIPLLTIA
jgi:hypothetical protein